MSSNPGSKRAFSSPKRPDRPWGPPQIQLVPELFPWRDVDHSIPPSAEVTNEWSYTPTPATCLQGVDRVKFTFIFFTLLKYTHKATSHRQSGRAIARLRSHVTIYRFWNMHKKSDGSWCCKRKCVLSENITWYKGGKIAARARCAETEFNQDLTSMPATYQTMSS